VAKQSGQFPTATPTTTPVTTTGTTTTTTTPGTSGTTGTTGTTLHETTNTAAEEVLPPFGYCHHATVLFPMWHRIYMSMMEQAVQLKMWQIAQRFPTEGELQETMIKAANRFRFPYWDPLRPRRLMEGENLTWECGAPHIVAVRIINVFIPEDTTHNHRPFARRRNPLYSYWFPEGETDKFWDKSWFRWRDLWLFEEAAKEHPLKDVMEGNIPNSSLTQKEKDMKDSFVSFQVIHSSFDHQTQG
jgi:hypothetical protein